MSTLQKNKMTHGPIKSLINYEEIDFSEYKEYGLYRLVDPLTKEVYKLHNKQLQQIQGEHCYDLWGHGHACSYCVSAEALLTKTEKTKMETLDDELFLAKVIPVLVSGKELVLELFQNLSNTYLKVNQEYQKLSLIVQKLNELASLESFTQLYSHSYTNNKLRTLIQGSSNIEVQDLCLAQLDINDLKYINDTFGHTTGDELILKVAEILEPFKASEHITPGRIGGDEFQIILVNMNLEQAKLLLSPVFQKLSHISLNKTSYIATVSYGLIQWDGKENDEEFINRADLVMYAHKRSTKKARNSINTQRTSEQQK